MKTISYVVKALGVTGLSAARRAGRSCFEGKSRARSGAVLAVTMLSLMGCTTLKPVAGSPAELRQRIAAGGLLWPGDRVVLTTTDGTRHKVAITGVASGSVQSKHGSIPIDQIVGVQKREFSVGKSVSLALGILVVGDAVVAALSAPAWILASTP